MIFKILGRWTNEVKCEVEIGAEFESKPRSQQLGEAVKVAIAQGKDLTRADLTRANLTRADLTEANLTEANLTEADLTRADLTVIRDDIWAVLSASPREVATLRDKIAAGEINGSAYEGKCSCLVGTIAAARHCSVNEIPGLEPDPGRASERFFMAIKTGDTPETNPASALALQWVDQWLASMREAFSVSVPV